MPFTAEETAQRRINIARIEAQRLAESAAAARSEDAQYVLRRYFASNYPGVPPVDAAALWELADRLNAMLTEQYVTGTTTELLVVEVYVPEELFYKEKFGPGNRVAELVDKGYVTELTRMANTKNRLGQVISIKRVSSRTSDLGMRESKRPNVRVTCTAPLPES